VRARRSVLRYAIDAAPVALVCAGLAVALVPFVAPMPLWALISIAAISYPLRFFAPLHQHNHSHLRTFHSARLNAMYDVVLSVAGGYVTAVWDLQHCVGHHRMHLDPGRDVAGRHRFTPDGPFARIIFTVLGTFLSTFDAMSIARTEGGKGKNRTSSRTLFLQLAIQIGIYGVLLAIDPLATLLCVLVPNAILRWGVFYVSYDHHRDVPGHDVYSGSVSQIGPVNPIFLNIGHHTAHHEKPTLHWSLLPARTKVILPRIPRECLR
jgi:beta-carotene hydroxylase